LHHIYRKLADIQIKGKQNGIIENIAKEKALAYVERKSNDRNQREWVISFRNRKQKEM
jgi:phage tail sheath gpL-like